MDVLSAALYKSVERTDKVVCVHHLVFYKMNCTVSTAFREIGALYLSLPNDDRGSHTVTISCLKLTSRETFNNTIVLRSD